MKQPRVSIIKLSVCLFTFFIFFLSFQALAQKPGAHYFADADGNGIIEVPDLIALNTVLGDFSADDTLIYNGYPQSRYRQDLDGNGVIEVPDLIILNGWIPGDFSNNPGIPDQLALDGDTHLNLNLGDSITLSAYALSPVSAGSQVRTGFGVIFKIDPSSTCTTAKIHGYDVAGGATVNAWRSNSAYHYTLQPGAPDNGRANVRVNTNGCTIDQTIKVEFYIPDDSEAGIPPGRFPSKLAAAQLIAINVNPPPCQQVTAINVTPQNPIVDEGSTIRFTATCTLADLSQVICTDSYCGISTMWTASGDLSQLTPANLFQAYWDGFSGTVTATFDDISHPEVSNSSVVMIRDYNPNTTITSQPSDPSNNQNPDFSFICNEGNCTFECNLDSSGWNTCTSPKHYTSLADGPHTFAVRAIDGGGRIDLTPATYSWTIDATPPATFITSYPANPTNATGAIFEFYCTGGPCTFECKLDSGSWISCTSPASYSGLSEGSHTFWVRATDQLGNLETSPPSYTWQIDLTPPDTFIDSGPSDPSIYKSAVFTFHCSGGPCTFECNLDSGGWIGCSSPKNYEGLAESSHDFMVRAIDGAGNVDPDPPSYTWVIAQDHGSWVQNTILRNPLEPRSKHTAVWTGAEMIVWGGNSTSFNSGARYNPSTDSWTPTSTINAPSRRSQHKAVWTGTEMIVFGGGSGGTYVKTGGKYYPDIDSWTPTSTTNAPSSGQGFTAVWTGTEMIIWGGQNGGMYNTGGRYNPVSDSWIKTSITNAPVKRWNHTAVWTGTEMIIWGGSTNDSGTIYLNTGGRYNPLTDSWIETSALNVPDGRSLHAAVWTGTEMIVWGGTNGYLIYLNTGGRYDPFTDSWTATSTANAPSARRYHTAVWTGTEMIVWGGNNTNTGGRYDPAWDYWMATAIPTNLSGRDYHTAVWTGTEMIVWGGYHDFSLNTGGRYNPSNDSWMRTYNDNAPSATSNHTAVWTGSEMIIYGAGGSYSAPGGRYNPATDSWIPISCSPDGRYYHTAVWTGTLMIVWGGFTSGPNGLYTGIKYNPSTNSCTSTPYGTLPGGSYYHTAVWTGTRMIVWGGYRYCCYYSFDPVTDQWGSISTTNDPGCRYHHTAVWTGTEMIVWGGYNNSPDTYYNTGGRYNPLTRTWTSTSLTNAPSARDYHTAVWSGTEMIVWGGGGGYSSYLNTGGRYNPTTDSWTATSTSDAPSGRWQPTAVWTGTEMIIWGGIKANVPLYFNDGGRYNPATDSWTSTSLTNAPSERHEHTAVWSGIEMIVWGGSDGYGLGDGGRYVP